MMSIALAHQFLLVLCFKLLWAMSPQSFGHQPTWTNPPTHLQMNTYEAVAHQQALQFGSRPTYPVYGPPITYPAYGAPGMYQYPYDAPMSFPAYGPPGTYTCPNPYPNHGSQHMYASQYHAPSNMAPGLYMPPGPYQALAPPSQGNSSPITSCSSASLRVTSRTWDNNSRSMSSSVDVPKVEASATATKEDKQVNPWPAGSKSTFAPKRLAPLRTSRNTGDTKPRGSAPSAAPKPYKPFVPAAAAPGPVVETKPANPWAAKDIAKMVRNQNYMPHKSHVRHIIYYLDPEEYKHAYASGVDPRDLAFAYIMFGQRLWNNVLHPLAQRLGEDFTTLVLHNIDAFEKAFLALDDASKKMAMDATFIENLDLNDVRMAIRMYRNRLRICHPKQFPRKFKGGKSVEATVNSTVLMAHFDYLFKWTGRDQADTAAKALETGYSISQNMTQHLAQRAHTSQDEASRLAQQAYYGGDRVAKIDGQMVPFAKEGETDATLALLYIWDHYRPAANNNNFHNLRLTRNRMAHQEGSDQIYKAYVNAIYSGPSQSGIRQLLLACSRREDLEFEIPQYEVDETVQYDNDSAIEVIEDKTN